MRRRVNTGGREDPRDIAALLADEMIAEAAPEIRAMLDRAEQTPRGTAGPPEDTT